MNPEEIQIAIQSLETEELLLRFEGNTLTPEARLVYIEELKNRGVKVVGLEIDKSATKEAQRTNQAENEAFKRGAKRRWKDFLWSTFIIIFIRGGLGIAIFFGILAGIKKLFGH